MYAAALVRLPNNGALENNVGYLAQEWAKAMSAKGDHAAAAEALRTPQDEVPGQQGRRGLRQEPRPPRPSASCGAKKPEEALALLDAWKDLLPGPDDLQEAAAPVYDQWAETLADAKSWQEAVDVYAKALERFPKSGHLKQQRRRHLVPVGEVLQRREAVGRGHRDLRQGASSACPTTGLFKQNKAWCEAQKKKG